MSKNEKKSTKKVLWWVVSAALVLALAAVAALPALKDMVGAADGTTFSMTVTVDGEDTLFDDTLTAKEGETLADVMTRCITKDGGVVSETGEYGAYIVSICGREQDDMAGKYWTYTVNGEYAAVGASEYAPQEGDEICFDLSAMEW